MRALGDRGWLIFGSLACISYGFWGLFDKLSTSFSLQTSNAVLYGVSFALSCPTLLIARRRPNIYALLAGLCNGISNLIVLKALQTNLLVLVYPFISFGSVFFVLLDDFLEKPRRGSRRRVRTYGGALIATVGLSLSAIGLSGGFGQISTSNLNIEAISLGLIISLFGGFWVLFTYRCVRSVDQTSVSAAFWILTASFACSLATLVPETSSLTSLLTGDRFVFPALAGLAMFLGEYSTCFAFTGLRTSNRIKEILVAFLANGELLPLIFLSALLLGERSIEGFLGAAVVILGLLILHGAEHP